MYNEANENKGENKTTIKVAEWCDAFLSKGRYIN